MSVLLENLTLYFQQTTVLNALLGSLLLLVAMFSVLLVQLEALMIKQECLDALVAQLASSNLQLVLRHVSHVLLDMLPQNLEH
jgi:hypothetical protein